MTTETIQDARDRRAAIEAAQERLDARSEEQRQAAVRFYNRNRMTPRNIALGFRDAAREAWRLWGER